MERCENRMKPYDETLLNHMDHGILQRLNDNGLSAPPPGCGSLQGCLWPRVARPCASTASSGRGCAAAGNQGLNSVDSADLNMLKPNLSRTYTRT